VIGAAAARVNQRLTAGIKPVQAAMPVGVSVEVGVGAAHGKKLEDEESPADVTDQAWGEDRGRRISLVLGRARGVLATSPPRQKSPQRSTPSHLAHLACLAAASSGPAGARPASPPHGTPQLARNLTGRRAQSDWETDFSTPLPQLRAHCREAQATPRL
jgi:hypothetical protein